MKFVILKLIRFYQRTLSPNHGVFSGMSFYKGCRFYPTCSDYTYKAIEKYGAWEGGLRGLKRILKCHPLGKGGYDPV